MEKTRLYEQVRSAAGDKAAEEKFIEEFGELTVELSTAIVKVLHGNMIDDAHKNRIIEEIADVINVLEQRTGDNSIHHKVGVVCKVKLDRLQERLESGDLLKGLMK